MNREYFIRYMADLGDVEKAYGELVPAEKDLISKQDSLTKKMYAGLQAFSYVFGEEVEKEIGRGPMSYAVFTTQETDDIKKVLKDNSWDIMFDIESVDQNIKLPFSKAFPLIHTHWNSATDVFPQLEEKRLFRYKIGMLDSLTRGHVLRGCYHFKYDSLHVFFQHGNIGIDDLSKDNRWTNHLEKERKEKVKDEFVSKIDMKREKSELLKLTDRVRLLEQGVVMV